MRLKTNNNWTVDITERGYEIRPFGRNGCVVIVDYDLNIKISSSYTATFSLSELDKLNAEILNGITYLRQHPVFDVPKPKKLTRSQITEMSFYEDINGRGIFEIGTAEILINNAGFGVNRYGCPYVVGCIQNYTDIEVIQTGLISTGIAVHIMTKNKAGTMTFDSRANKSNNLRKRRWKCDKDVYKKHKIAVYVDGFLMLECMKTETNYISNN